jgi:hypothetical protein
MMTLYAKTYKRTPRTAVHVAMCVPLNNVQLASVVMWERLLVETRVLPILLLI